jgi:hypothetical protein
MDTD